MGKFPESKLLSIYSDWHWQRLPNKCYMTDLDQVIVGGGEIDIPRLWIEASSMGVNAIIDLKEPGADITWTEKIVYNDIEKNWGKPVYIIHPYNHYESDDGNHFKSFRVIRWSDDKVKEMSELEYIEWLCSLRNRSF